MRHKITLSYNGLKYSGWQIQNNATTIQGELDKALSILFGESVHTTGAGRTDAGVSATGYVCHFDTSDNGTDRAPHDKSKLLYKLNAILPTGIVVHDIEDADNHFNARFDAKRREYKYFVHRVKDPFAEQFSFHFRYPLDVDLMNEACTYLIGTHDFSCFEKTGGNNATSICTIFDAAWAAYTPDHVRMLGFGNIACSDCLDDKEHRTDNIADTNCKPEGSTNASAKSDSPMDCRYIVFTISADRFLRNMVRAIVGSLMDVGRGKRKPEWIGELISTGTRCDAGESVPGNALFLCKIDY